MFLKVTKVKGKHYAKFAESYREGGKVKQRIFANLGCLESISQDSLRNIINTLSKFLKEPDINKSAELSHDVAKIEESQYDMSFFDFDSTDEK